MHTQIVIQQADFDLSAEYAALRGQHTQIGAIATFTGLVRDFNLGDQQALASVSGLFLEHYPGMTEKVLGKIVAEAEGRWQLDAVRIIHRVGALGPGDQIVFVGVASAHRGDAFAACEFLMDFLKSKAPFWKREQTADGDRWVETRHSDTLAAERWLDT